MSRFQEKNPTKEELLQMELHDSFRISKTTIIVRVHGGWIYNIKDSVLNQMSSVFVPESINCYTREG